MAPQPEKKNKGCAKAGRNRSSLTGTYTKKAPRTRGLNRAVARYTRQMQWLGVKEVV